MKILFRKDFLFFNDMKQLLAFVRPDDRLYVYSLSDCMLAIYAAVNEPGKLVSPGKTLATLRNLLAKGIVIHAAREKLTLDRHHLPAIDRALRSTCSPTFFLP